MGSEKAFLSLSGKTLIEHAITKAKSIAADVFIVGPKEKFSAYGRTVQDVYPDCGPLAGIHAALKRSVTEFSLVLGVDTPFLHPDFLSYLVAESRKNSALVTVPKTNAGLQPLCAVYRKEFLPIAEHALLAGNYKIDALFPGNSSVVQFTSEEVKLQGFDPEMFDNINSPQDYERAVKRAALTAAAKKHS
ncbi:MAG: molybdenum cofactor guanylyltransferase [Acidobacteriales bacterium]|nr:molybdenum cofactor guanylyltransferase [Terriglobales bacterium]